MVNDVEQKFGVLHGFLRGENKGFPEEKKEKEDIKRQIKYFTKKHDEEKDILKRLDYSNRIYFWQKKLKEMT